MDRVDLAVGGVRVGGGVAFWPSLGSGASLAGEIVTETGVMAAECLLHLKVSFVGFNKKTNTQSGLHLTPPSSPRARKQSKIPALPGSQSLGEGELVPSQSHQPLDREMGGPRDGPMIHRVVSTVSPRSHRTHCYRIV